MTLFSKFQSHSKKNNLNESMRYTAVKFYHKPKNIQMLHIHITYDKQKINSNYLRKKKVTLQRFFFLSNFLFPYIKKNILKQFRNLYHNKKKLKSKSKLYFRFLI